MSRLRSRVQALEAGKGQHLSPALKAWLGWELTEAEQALLDQTAGIDEDFDDIDTSEWSQETKIWLGVE